MKSASLDLQHDWPLVERGLLLANVFNPFGARFFQTFAANLYSIRVENVCGFVSVPKEFPEADLGAKKQVGDG